MVRVVNKDPHPSVVKEVICRNCGLTLEYVPNDVKQDYTTDYTGDRDHYKFIECPLCEKEVRV